MYDQSVYGPFQVGQSSACAKWDLLLNADYILTWQAGVDWLTSGPYIKASQIFNQMCQSFVTINFFQTQNVHYSAASNHYIDFLFSSFQPLYWFFKEEEWFIQDFKLIYLFTTCPSK